MSLYPSAQTTTSHTKSFPCHCTSTFFILCYSFNLSLSLFLPSSITPCQVRTLTLTYNKPMLCPNCVFDNPPDMVFCGKCGLRISHECPNCQSMMPLSFQFCGRCGSHLVVAAMDMPLTDELSASPTTLEEKTLERTPPPPLKTRSWFQDQHQ